MKIYRPAYFNDFKCSAQSCRHSCCKGWEIDIDEESLSRFGKEKGALGKRLSESVSTDETPHFILREDGSCPFLNSEGLCDMYAEKGKDYLCQICRDHPVFRNFYEDRIEEGLGLACEEAARLILTQKHPFRLEAVKGKKEELPPDEQDLVDLRDYIISVLSDRSVPVDERVDSMLSFCEIEGNFKGEELKTSLPLHAAKADNTLTIERLELAKENLAVYLAFRHIADALYDNMLPERIYRVAEYYYKVRNLWALEEDLNWEKLTDIVRQFSVDCEYVE